MKGLTGRPLGGRSSAGSAQQRGQHVEQCEDVRVHYDPPLSSAEGVHIGRSADVNHLMGFAV
jgi:hypothetical protein